jgi:4-hydroxymandelate oxidase
MAGLESGPEDPNLLNVHDYERAAARVLSPGAMAYYSGGAMDEATLAANRDAFSRHHLVPRMMRDVSHVDLGVTVFGRRWRLPLWSAPTALQQLAHVEGELAAARACKARDVTYTLSTSASTDMEDVARVGGPRWFQVYLLEDLGARKAMIERAISHGYEALMLTVDLQRLGRRERDPKAAFSIPNHIGLPNIGRAAGVDPLDAASVPFTPVVTWKDLEWLAKLGRPVIVKGILHPDDAKQALDCGAAAIAVSNHGGRQLDRAIGALDALPKVVDAVAGRAPVFVDGGFRRGTEVLIALALGATAVGLGRPILWGLSVAGEQGVARVLDLVTHELELSMALSGCASLKDVGRALLSQ